MRHPARFHRRLSFPLSMVLALGACALSPQVVEIRPELDGTEFSGRQAPATISLEVIDARSNPVIGYRGGVYDTATITAEQAMRSAVRTALSGALARRGLRIANPGDRGDIALVVEIVELKYAVTQEHVKRTIETVATVRARSSGGNRTRTGEYRDRRTREVLKAPGAQDNEEMINNVLSGALQRLVSDPELLDY